VDAGSSDAGARKDAATHGPARAGSGCGCALGGEVPRLGHAVFALLAVAFLARRRRRR
jgi:MYXO-CTERM domain-containing protein